MAFLAKFLVPLFPTGEDYASEMVKLQRLLGAEIDATIYKLITLIITGYGHATIVDTTQTPHPACNCKLCISELQLTEEEHDKKVQKSVTMLARMYTNVKNNNCDCDNCAIKKPIAGWSAPAVPVNSPVQSPTNKSNKNKYAGKGKYAGKRRNRKSNKGACECPRCSRNATPVLDTPEIAEPSTIIQDIPEIVSPIPSLHNKKIQFMTDQLRPRLMQEVDTSEHNSFPACGLASCNEFVPLMHDGVELVNIVNKPVGMTEDFYTRQRFFGTVIDIHEWFNIPFLEKTVEWISFNVDQKIQARVRFLEGAYFLNRKTQTYVHAVTLMEQFRDFLDRTGVDTKEQNGVFYSIVDFDKDMKGFTICY